LVIPAIREGKEKGSAREQPFAGFDSRGKISIASEPNDCITLVVEDDSK